MRLIASHLKIGGCQQREKEENRLPQSALQEM